MKTRYHFDPDDPTTYELDEQGRVTCILEKPRVADDRPPYPIVLPLPIHLKGGASLGASTLEFFGLDRPEDSEETDDEFAARVKARIDARLAAPPGCPACAGMIVYAHTCERPEPSAPEMQKAPTSR